MMNIARFLKGTITFRELENLPNRYIHTFYHEYVDMLKDEAKKKNKESEDVSDEIEDKLT